MDEWGWASVLMWISTLSLRQAFFYGISALVPKNVSMSFNLVEMYDVFRLLLLVYDDF
jgi:hypothetical protein